MKHGNNLSSSFLVNQGVKQVSVLSPSLFLTVMNSLLQQMRDLILGGSTFVGTADHAGDVRSIVPNVHHGISQSSELLSVLVSN